MNRRQAPAARIALALSLVMLLLAVAVTLSANPAAVASSNSIVAAEEFNRITGGRYVACQGNETLPRDTTAIRLSLDSVLGPPVKVRVLQGKRLLTSGASRQGWTAADVTVPVKPPTHTYSHVELCFEFSPRDESVGLIGERTAAARSAGSTQGVLKVEYMRPGNRSWWSLASSVVAHMGRGHAWSGAWIAPFLAAAMGAIAAAVYWLALRLVR